MTDITKPLTLDGIKQTPEMTMLLNNKQDGFDYRERRHPQWKENYTLYRDRVIVNRLTQRQSVNIPLMKQTVKTLLKDVDDMPVLYFENLDNDKEAETFLNEYWKWTVQMNNMQIMDIVDKKQVFLFGRSFIQVQIIDGMVKFTVVDPQDILVSRYIDPTDINSSRYLCHTHIYVPVNSLGQNEDYDPKAIEKLKKWHATDEGIAKIGSNSYLHADKDQKMNDMGLNTDVSLGEGYVELTQHFVFRDEGDGEQIYLYVEADDQVILMKKKLEDIMGVTKDNYWQTHFPYNTWADDLERQDFWSDGVADTVRTPNKILNSFYSQLIENRTLRNYNMHYYDSTGVKDTFMPNTFNPTPWGWYGIPGNPNEFMKTVTVPDLSESMDEMDFIINMTEKATGATATQQGNVQQREVTLGEVQLALGEAKERVKGMAKFYTPAWQLRGEMFLKVIEGSPEKLDAVKINKKGRNSSDIYEREITPNDWMSKSGYSTKVWSLEDKNTQDSDMLQKLNATATLMPLNKKLKEIYQRKLLEFDGLPPDDINAVMEEERLLLEQANANPQIQAPTDTVGQAQPIQDDTVGKLEAIRKNINQTAK